MNSLLLESKENLLGLGILGIVALSIILAFASVSFIASIWKFVLVARYRRYNKQKVAVNMTGAQVAEKMLEGLGLNDVKVEQLGFFKALIFGNSYSPKKKAIRLRKNIYNTASLTAVTLATQKVAIAQKHHEGDKKVALRANLMMIGYFAPFAVLPLVVIGVLLDLFVLANIGTFSIVFTAIAFSYYIFSIIVMILNIKIEKKACATAIEFMQKVNLLTEEEIEDAQHLYKTYITDYWLQFFSELLYVIWETIKLVWRIVRRNKK